MKEGINDHNDIDKAEAKAYGLLLVLCFACFITGAIYGIGIYSIYVDNPPLPDSHIVYDPGPYTIERKTQ